MAFDFSKLARACEFSLELKSLGAVRCRSLTTDHFSQARTRLNSSDVQSLGFVRWLLGEIMQRPVEKFDDEDKVIDGPSLTEDELNSVTDGELEEFADKLIQKNKYLFKTHKGNDIEKSADESNCNFLVRAFLHHAAEEKAQWERLTKSASASSFANAALEAIKSDLGSTNRLRDAIDKSLLGTSVAERFLADKKAQRVHITQSVSNSLFANATLEAMQTKLAQQSALGSIADANRYMADGLSFAAMETTLKREHEIMRAATSPLLDTQRYLEQVSVSATLAKAIYQSEDRLREAVCGMTQRESISAAIAAGLEKQQQQTRDLLKSHEAMFRLPLAYEAARLLNSYQVGTVDEFAQRQAKEVFDRQHALHAITTPWLHKVDAARSVTAILELQGLGSALRTTKGFDLELTAALRLDLGDWRDKITFPERTLIDPVARTEFYVARGFNTALTDFPEAAFHQGLHLAGLDGETLDFDLYGTADRPSADPEEEAGLQRTNKCHDRLQRFERRLRQFIDAAMTAQYGSDWPRQRLAPKLYEQWEFKKKRAESSGTILTFIEVADFTDYETIICKQDHWREIFEIRFKKKESVRESFQRLWPIRLAAMHARIVTKEDELYLVAEVVRLLSAIK